MKKMSMKFENEKRKNQRILWKTYPQRSELNQIKIVRKKNDRQ
jgi:hypothetical protein